MEKTLVVILSETREYELTFANFKQNVIDELNADLCLCIGVKSNYNYENPFYKAAKYRFLYNEEDDRDFSKSLELSYKETADGPIPERGISEAESVGIGRFSGEATQELRSEKQQTGQGSGFADQKHYTEFLQLKPHVGYFDRQDSPEFINFCTSTYIHIFFLWFLQKNAKETDLLSKYDRIIIARSDYIYNLPFPKMKILDASYIWVPDWEDYGGLCDRTVVLSATHFESYVSILEHFHKRANAYYTIIEGQFNWNMERILRMHLEETQVYHLVRRYPYISYAVRSANGSSRWSTGEYHNGLGYCIKYNAEYERALYYKNEYENSNEYGTIDTFYQKYINP